MTTAEQVREQFETSLVTVSISTLAKKLGGVRHKANRVVIHTFPDGSSIHAFGAGRSHRYWTEAAS